MRTFEIGWTTFGDTEVDVDKLAVALTPTSGVGGTLAIEQLHVRDAVDGSPKWVNWRIKLREVTYSEARRIRDAVNEVVPVDVPMPTEDMPEDVDSYGMYTQEGAHLVRNALDNLVGIMLEHGHEAGIRQVGTWMNLIAQAGHGEVYDTDVRDRIWGDLERFAAKELGVSESEFNMTWGRVAG